MTASQSGSASRTTSAVMSLVMEASDCGASAFFSNSDVPVFQSATMTERDRVATPRRFASFFTGMGTTGLGMDAASGNDARRGGRYSSTERPGLAGENVRYMVSATSSENMRRWSGGFRRCGGLSLGRRLRFGWFRRGHLEDAHDVLVRAELVELGKLFHAGDPEEADEIHGHMEGGLRVVRFALRLDQAAHEQVAEDEAAVHAADLFELGLGDRAAVGDDGVSLERLFGQFAGGLRYEDRSVGL